MNKPHKILVVDDLPDWRATLGGLLEDVGYEVQVADSFEEALAVLQAGGFDLAVIDLRLDESDEENVQGLDLAAEIGKRWPDIKSVIITGYGTPETVQKAIALDVNKQRLVDEFIPKVESDHLVQVVQKVLEPQQETQSK